MECPKCGGGAYLSEEELVQILSETDPVKILIKAVYVCRACSERFSRLVYDDLSSRKREPAQTQRVQQTQEHMQIETVKDEPAESLKFF